MSTTLASISDQNIVKNVFLGKPSDFPLSIDITDAYPRPGPGWGYVDGKFIPPEEPDPAPAPPAEPRIITNLAFDLRFQSSERVAIELASLDDPSAPMEQRQQAAYIRVSLQRANKASYTDLDDPVTREAVEQFEAFGMIAEGRAAEILDAPVQDSERP